MAKELVKETQYFKAFFEAEHELLTIQWLPTSEDMEDEECLSEHILIANLNTVHNPKLGIGDNRDLLYVIDPDIQEEIDKQCAPIYMESGLQKLASIQRKDNFMEQDAEVDVGNLSIEQMTNETNHAQLEIKVFITEEEARDWLLS